ncbi:MAG: hypothetical protein U0324_18565 [Polyangiales bacterium]
MKLFQDGDGWDAQRRVVLHMLATLLACGAHPAEVEQLQHQLARWRAIELQRQEADNASVIANARVAWVNDDLDEVTTVFAAQLLIDCGRDRSHPTYARFFPESVTAITVKGLDAQLQEMKDFPLFGEEIKLPEASAKGLTVVLRAMADGRAALDAREEAEREAARVSVAQGAWREEANTARRAIDTALQAHATKNSLPRSYPERFHRPAYEKPAKKKAATPPAQPTQPTHAQPADPVAALSPHDQVLALSDVVLRGLADDFVASLPTNVQAIVRARRAR